MLRYMLRDAARKSSGRSGDVSDAQADAPFLRALNKTRERFQEKSINTRELLQVFEEELPPSLCYEGKQSLDWFYEGWVNGTALPHLELHGVKYTQKPGGSVVTGTIVQEDAPEGACDSRPGLCRGWREDRAPGPGIRGRTGNELSSVRAGGHTKGRTRSLSDLTDATAVIKGSFPEISCAQSRNDIAPFHSDHPEFLKVLVSPQFSLQSKDLLGALAEWIDGLQNA